MGHLDKPGDLPRTLLILQTGGNTWQASFLSLSIQQDLCVSFPYRRMTAQQVTSTEILLSTQALGWAAGSRQILKQISLQLPSGVTAGLIGPNGAGKTSLLRCLTSFYADYTGEISYQDKPLAQWPNKALAQQLALVSQQNTSNLAINLLELVRMGLLPYKSAFAGDSQADLELIADCLEHVGLQDRATQSISTLSGGELQRALIAKALVQQPKLLLLDEPTNHLDLCYQLDIMRLIKRLSITTLATLHDVNLAAQFCDWLILIKQGQLLACGPTEQVFNQRLLSELFERDCVVTPHPFHSGVWMNFKECYS